MKRLFCVKDSKGKIVGIPNEGTFLHQQTQFVPTKKLAKEWRDECNKHTTGHTVAIGPDHWRY